MAAWMVLLFLAMQTLVAHVTTSTPTSPAEDRVASIIRPDIFEEMLKYRNDTKCSARNIFTYDAFIDAANFFNGFGTVGDANTRKRELAAFMAQTSHETTGGWATAPSGPYAWGYCKFGGKTNTDDYCNTAKTEWPCAPGRQYYGRGPFQISYNYNYGQAGKALGVDLLNDPNLASQVATISFKTAIWFWMTPQLAGPSCHDVMTGGWIPSNCDIDGGRLPGFGVTTNIINGGVECGIGPDPSVDDRIGFYKRYCALLGVDPGENIDCYHQKNFASSPPCPHWTAVK